MFVRDAWYSPYGPLLSLAKDGGPNRFRGIVRDPMTAETQTMGGAEAARAR